jgi:signal transduction histidine kinase
MTIAARLKPMPDHPGIGLSGLIADPLLRAAVSVTGAGLSLWATADGLPPRVGTAVLAALAVAGLAWLLLAAERALPVVPAAVVALGAAGGVITPSDRYGVIFIGVAAASAAVAFDPRTAFTLAAAGPAACAAAAAAAGTFGSLDLAATVALVGLVAGGGRRDIMLRARQAALVATARQRAEVAAERNRLGREMHDVLAHTLGALSIHLTALDSLARNGAGRQELIGQIERGQELVGEGLDEARQAVRALRGDDDRPLDAQLTQLCALRGASLEISGTAREVGPDARLTLYRVTQEALTNAAKHAPGATVRVQLLFGAQEVTVTVLNTAPGSAASIRLAGAGGGYGLSGLRERVQQAGGLFQAGPQDGGWRVTARIPA